MTNELTRMQHMKQSIRLEAEANRRAQPQKDELSRIICGKFAALPEYAEAATVMFYVHVRSEVRTRGFLRQALGEGKRLVVPYCLGDELRLFLLRSMEELATGTYGIPEPKPELRELSARCVDISQLDLIMVPGVGFDRQGGRLGHGKGYYDRLLGRARPDTPRVALAFECQVFAKIPMLPGDVSMDKVITEKGVWGSA